MMLAGLPVVDVPADRSALDAFSARLKRRQTLLIMRRHVPWPVRKHQPQAVAALVQQFQIAYQQIARNYMQVQ